MRPDISGISSESLRLVLLRSPYDCWDDPRVPPLFERIIALKLKGYSQEYPYGVLPIDTYDFVGTHLAICRERKQGSSPPVLEPLLAFKSVTLSKVTSHSLPFPPLALLNASRVNTLAHQQQIDEILARCEREGIEISYDGSWTIDPMVRRDRELTGRLREMMMAVMTHYYEFEGIREQIGCGVPRFKTERYFQSYGYEPLREDSSDLPALPQTSLQGEPVIMMHCRRRSALADELAIKHVALWSSRLVLPDQTAEEAPLPQRKAA